MGVPFVEGSVRGGDMSTEKAFSPQWQEPV